MEPMMRPTSKNALSWQKNIFRKISFLRSSADGFDALGAAARKQVHENTARKLGLQHIK